MIGLSTAATPGGVAAVAFYAFRQIIFLFFCRFWGNVSKFVKSYIEKPENNI